MQHGVRGVGSRFVSGHPPELQDLVHRNSIEWYGTKTEVRSKLKCLLNKLVFEGLCVNRRDFPLSPVRS